MFLSHDTALEKITILTNRLNIAETRLSSLEKAVEKIEYNYISRTAFNKLVCRFNATFTDLK